MVIHFHLFILIVVLFIRLLSRRTDRHKAALINDMHFSFAQTKNTTTLLLTTRGATTIMNSNSNVFFLLQHVGVVLLVSWLITPLTRTTTVEGFSMYRDVITRNHPSTHQYSSPPSPLSSSSLLSDTTATAESSVVVMKSNQEQDGTTSRTLPDNVILYDGVCNFCNTWVDILLRVDRQGQFRFAPLQSSIGQDLLVQIGKQADDISSVVLVRQDGSYYDKSLCVLQVLEQVGDKDLGLLPLKPLAQLARRWVDRDIRDGLYDMVADNRYSLMGKRQECRCSDPTYADRFLF